MGDILITAAVAGEMEDIRKRVAGPEILRTGRQEVIRGRIGKQTVQLAVTGPGIANTVHGLTAALAIGKPELILQTGCGGGFSQAGIRLGDIAVASGEIDAQFGREDAGTETGVSALSFPVMKRTDPAIFNCYPVDSEESEDALKILETAFAGSGVNILKGPFVTVSTVTTSAGRSDSLHRQYGALIENMEGSGAAHVAALYDIPFLEIRAVSNPVGAGDKRDWDLRLSFRRCAQAVISYMENRSAL